MRLWNRILRWLWGTMTCPECQVGELRLRSAEATEPHGERHVDEWWECNFCHEKFDEEELERVSRC